MSTRDSALEHLLADINKFPDVPSLITAVNDSVAEHDKLSRAEIARRYGCKRQYIYLLEHRNSPQHVSTPEILKKWGNAVRLSDNQIQRIIIFADGKRSKTHIIEDVQFTKLLNLYIREEFLDKYLVAKQAQVDPQTLYAILSGENFPLKTTAQKIVNGLGFDSIEEFMAFTQPLLDKDPTLLELDDFEWAADKYIKDKGKIDPLPNGRMFSRYVKSPTHEGRAQARKHMAATLGFATVKNFFTAAEEKITSEEILFHREEYQKAVNRAKFPIVTMEQRALFPEALEAWLAKNGADIGCINIMDLKPAIVDPITLSNISARKHVPHVKTVLAITKYLGFNSPADFFTEASSLVETRSLPAKAR